MISKNEIKRFFFENKEGIVIGGVVGYILGKYFLQDYFDMSIMGQTFGIIDVVKGATASTIELAKTKIIWASTIIGAVIGMILDNALPEKFWRK